MGAAARRGGLEPEQEPVAPEPAIAGPPLAVAAPTVAGRLLSLQRQAGNRAVLQLMRQPTAAARRGASISIVVERPMTPHDFAVRAFMQAFRMPADVAEQRVLAYEAGGGRAGSGPNFEHGVRPDEVGKPLRLNYPLPMLSEAEQADVTGRAEQLAALPKEQRSAIDEETDRRFWQQTGMATGTKLSATGTGDAPNRELWMRARDSVMRDRKRIATLPARTRELLVPGTTEVAPEQYATVVRIADKLATFTEDDWALYQRRINATTDDYARVEESIDRFRRRQQAEASVNDRIKNTGSVYAAWTRFKGTPKPFPGVGGGVSSGQIPGYDERYYKARDDLDKAVVAAGFADLADYEAACNDWLLLFRARAVELTLLALKASEQVVSAELTRYQNPAEVSALHSKQATMRRLDTEAYDALRRTMPTMTQVYASGQTPRTPEQIAADKEYQEKSAQAEAERTKLAADYPILKDQRFHTYEMNVSDPAELGKRLRQDASDRLANITQTRNRVLTDPDAIYQFDRIRELALQELGAAAPDAVGRLVVQDHLKQISDDNLLKGIAVAVLAIGLGLLSFGTGTVAVLAGAGALGLSVYTAADEWDRYDKASAAAHTAFDKDKTVSSDDPSILWLALSLVAVGLDGAALVGALKAAAPAAKVLSETGSAAKFEETLAKATELSEGVQKALAKQAKAEEGFIKASEDLSAYLKGRLYSGIDPVYLAKVTKAAYFAAAEGIRDFQVFLAKLKLQKFAKAVELEKLSATELEALQNAFKAGVKEFENAAPVFSMEVRYAAGTSKLTIGADGKLLLDGKAIGAGAEHAEVIQKLGLTHSYKGHGAGRDVVTIANEALQNAAKPKGAGMSSMFRSDETMLRSLQAAQADVAAGKGVRSGAYTLVDVPTTPNTGRVFVAKAKMPAGATPIPFPALPDVAELPATHVRALFTETRPGVFEIADLFPAYK
jgi:hypothetical protein